MYALSFSAFPFYPLVHTSRGARNRTSRRTSRHLLLQLRLTKKSLIHRKQVLRKRLQYQTKNHQKQS